MIAIHLAENFRENQSNLLLNFRGHKEKKSFISYIGDIIITIT